MTAGSVSPTNREAAEVRPCTASGIIAGIWREKSGGICSARESLKSNISASTGRFATDQWIHSKPHTGIESGSRNSQCRYLMRDLSKSSM